MPPKYSVRGDGRRDGRNTPALLAQILFGENLQLRPRRGYRRAAGIDVLD